MDINNYSYTPYILENESEPQKHSDKYWYWSIHDIRSISLDICCDFIKDYKTASLETKNFIYDAVQAKVKTLI
jgi:hypothetical protein